MLPTSLAPLYITLTKKQTDRFNTRQIYLIMDDDDIPDAGQEDDNDEGTDGDDDDDLFGPGHYNVDAAFQQDEECNHSSERYSSPNGMMMMMMHCCCREESSAPLCLCDRDNPNVTATSIPTLDESLDDSFDYYYNNNHPASGGEEHDFDETLMINNTTNDSTTLESTELILTSTPCTTSTSTTPTAAVAAAMTTTTKSATTTTTKLSWTDDDYPAIAYITPSGDSVMEMLMRKSQRKMALLLIVVGGAAIVVVVTVLSFTMWSLRYSMTMTTTTRTTITMTTTPYAPSSSRVTTIPPASEVIQKIMEPNDNVSTIRTNSQFVTTEQFKAQNVTAQSALHKVDASRSLSIWRPSNKDFNGDARNPSADTAGSLSRLCMPKSPQFDRDNNNNKAVGIHDNTNTTTTATHCCPTTTLASNSDELLLFQEIYQHVHTNLSSMLLPTMLPRSFYFNRHGMLSYHVSPTLTVRQMSVLATKSTPSSSNDDPHLPLPNTVVKDYDDDDDDNVTSVWGRFLSFLHTVRGTGTKSQAAASVAAGQLEMMQILTRPSWGTIPLYVAQLSTIQIARTTTTTTTLPIHDMVSQSMDATATTTPTTLRPLLDLVAAQKRVVEWFTLERNDDWTNMLEIHNNPVAVWGTIPSNLGQSSLLVGLLDHPTVVEPWVRESLQHRRRRRRRRRDEASRDEDSLPRRRLAFSVQSASAANSNVFQELARIQRWMAPANGLAGTISTMGPCAMHVALYLQI